MVQDAPLDHVDQCLGHRGSESGPFLKSLQMGGKVFERGLSEHHFWKLMRASFATVKVEPPVLPHDLGSWLTTSLLDKGTESSPSLAMWDIEVCKALCDTIVGC